MKKIISFLLLAAMLIGCMIPAGLVSAADCAIAAGSVEVLEGASTANIAVSISGNPGVAYAKLVVVYAASELALSDDAASDLFNTVSTGSERAGTHKDVKNYLPDGATGSDYKGFVVELENLDEESGEYIDVTADGAIVNLSLDLVAPEVGSTYAIYVTAVEATNAAEDEVVIAGELVEGSISVLKDENLGKYDDFTMFFAPESVTVEAGEKANVDLRLDANPGLWSIRCMIVYPEALSLEANSEGIAIVENGVIFADSDLNPGIANLPLTDDRLLIQYKDYFAAEGIATEGYNSVVLYYEPEAYDAVISGNGVLASLAFNTDNCVAGETYDIDVYYVTGDIFRAEANQVFVDLFPATVGATVTIPADPSQCTHKTTTETVVDATCDADGSKTVVCDICGTTVSTEVIPATGHAYGDVVVVTPATCTSAGAGTQTCANCGDVVEVELPVADHTPSDATCGEKQTCTVCGTVLAEALEHVAGDPVTVPATCTEDGSKTVSCTRCGETLSTEVIKAPGHNYLQPGSTVIVPPTCIAGGYTQKTCQVCGEVAIMDETEPDPEAHEIVKIDAVEPGCHYLGNIEYWYCTVCETFWQDEDLTQITNSKNVILPALGSDNLVHFDAVAPACHFNGNIEYWYCPDCEQFWQDEALTQLTNSKNVVLPATGSDNVEHVAAKDPTCAELGNIEYWYCPDCDQYFADEAHTQITNRLNVLIGTLDHTIVHFDAVAPACHYNGNIEYWYCSECDGFWADEALTQITNSKSVILPAVGGDVVHFDAIEPACHYNGNIEYWFCPECEQFWQDEALTQLTNSKNVILPATCSENVVHFEAIEPGCHYNGQIEYWYCPDCDQFFADEAHTQITNALSVILPATGSENVVHFDAVEPGCHYNGNIEYWFCADCGQFWADEALTQLTNGLSVVLPATGSENVKHVEAKAPTATEDGNIEYWFCPECEQFWQDEALTQLTNSKNVILPATGETADDNNGADNNETVKPSKPTGDNMMWIIIALAVVAMGSVAIVVIRRRRNAQ